MKFNLDFGITDILIFICFFIGMIIMVEYDLFGVKKTIYGGQYKYVAISGASIIFTLLYHVKF